jgi:hypothetical protein
MSGYSDRWFSLGFGLRRAELPRGHNLHAAEVGNVIVGIKLVLAAADTSQPKDNVAGLAELRRLVEHHEHVLPSRISRCRPSAGELSSSLALGSFSGLACTSIIYSCFGFVGLLLLLGSDGGERRAVEDVTFSPSAFRCCQA